MGECISPIHLNYQSWDEDAKDCVKDFSRPTKNKMRSLHHIKTKLVWSKSRRRIALNFHMVFIA
jgi:hypothetical protein